MNDVHVIRGRPVRGARCGPFLSFLVFSLVGCAGTPIVDVAAEVNATLHPAVLALAPGDTLRIRFTNFPEWDHQTQVRPDGKASFLAVDEMHVAGLTAQQVDEKLTAAYTGTLQEPDLTVLVESQAERSYVVMGEVQEPGPQTLDGGRVTLAAAIGRAGGPDAETALLENTLLVRWLPEENQQVWWEIDASPEQWATTEAILLQPFDVVYVPNKRIVRVNIWIRQHITNLIPIPISIPVAAGG